MDRVQHHGAVVREGDDEVVGVVAVVAVEAGEARDGSVVDADVVEAEAGGPVWERGGGEGDAGGAAGCVGEEEGGGVEGGVADGGFW